uniref:Uncharacterized protein n=1 Tax=Arundo donax TaxID=35708 RepID=A0A0A9GDG0_ARUDO
MAAADPLWPSKIVNTEMVSSSLPPFSLLPLPPSAGVRWHLAMRSVKSSPFLFLQASPKRMSGFSTFWLQSSRFRSTASGTPDPSTSCISIGSQASKSLAPNSPIAPKELGGDGSDARQEMQRKRLLEHQSGGTFLTDQPRTSVNPIK